MPHAPELSEINHVAIAIVAAALSKPRPIDGGFHVAAFFYAPNNGWNDPSGVIGDVEEAIAMAMPTIGKPLAHDLSFIAPNLAAEYMKAGAIESRVAKQYAIARGVMMYRLDIQYTPGDA